MITVIDNFLSQFEADVLSNMIMDQKILWSCSSTVHDDNPLSPRCEPKYNFQMCHVFLENKSQVMINKNTFHLLGALITRINPSEWVRIKMNLNPCNSQIIEHGYHIDHSLSRNDSWTAIYYVNSNNGYTVFEDGSKIESVKNRLVLFQSQIRHSGTTCTDIYARLVLNLNFYKDDIEELIANEL